MTTEINEEEELNKLEEALEIGDSKQKDATEKTSEAMLGGEVEFAGLKLRPVTLSTLAMLEKVGSPLVSGEESGNMVIEALIFIWLQSEDLESVKAAVLTSDMDSRIVVEAKALEL